MKTKKIVQQLNASLDEASRCASKRRKMLETFLKQIEVVEKGLLKQLQKESQKSKKKQIKKKLSLVRSAYTSLR